MHEMDGNAERTVATPEVERAQAWPDSQQPGAAATTATAEGAADPWSGGATAAIEPLGRAAREARGTEERGHPEPVPSVAQIGGHPLHPMVVPLPIGALTLAAVSDLAYAATGDRTWARSSQFLVAAGVVTGLTAASLGAVDFLGREQTRRHGEAWIHAGGNLAVVSLSALNLAMRRGRGTSRSIVPAGLLLSAICALILAVTGWLGGELTYRHRIGVTKE